MPLPTELAACLAKYASCTEYSDRGVVHREANSGAQIETDSIEFATHFSRSVSLKFKGKSIASRPFHVQIQSDDIAFQAAFVDTWTLEYDWRSAIYTASFFNGDVVEASQKTIDEALNLSNPASAGCAGIIPALLLGVGPYTINWAAIQACHFDLTESGEGVLIRADDVRDSLRLSLLLNKSTGLFNRITRERTFNSDPPVLALLEDELKRLDAQRDKELIRMHETTISVLKSQRSALKVTYSFIDSALQP